MTRSEREKKRVGETQSRFDVLTRVQKVGDEERRLYLHSEYIALSGER
jgi:hypothetical protein